MSKAPGKKGFSRKEKKKSEKKEKPKKHTFIELLHFIFLTGCSPNLLRAKLKHPLLFRFLFSSFFPFVYSSSEKDMLSDMLSSSLYTGAAAVDTIALPVRFGRAAATNGFAILAGARFLAAVALAFFVVGLRSSCNGSRRSFRGGLGSNRLVVFFLQTASVIVVLVIAIIIVVSIVIVIVSPSSALALSSSCSSALAALFDGSFSSWKRRVGMVLHVALVDDLLHLDRGLRRLALGFFDHFHENANKSRRHGRFP